MAADVDFSLETVKTSKNALLCSIYRYTADQWAQEGCLTLVHSLDSVDRAFGPCIRGMA
jgi:hypothetical protein